MSAQEMNVDSKICLVTGAGSGIGATTAKHLAARGMTVVCADLNGDGAAQVAADIVAAGGSATAATLDVTDDVAVSALVEQIVADHGRLDVAVNSAGIGDPERNHLADVDPAAWHRVIGVNLTGVFFCMRAEIDAMLRTGGGSIVNMASVHSLVGRSMQAAYVASKHGVVGLTKAAAIEYGDRAIRVNAVCPGYIETPLLVDMPTPMREQIEAKHPVGRLGTPEEVAEVVDFLAGDSSSFVTGAAYTVDGGYTAQ
ncbi:SDR family NAD(P)-dependent oxidoreductase [Gordonia sp. (in: high G+C Gram-positive bacteria)]|uniref:SDR family NAD(P)-dependent oxidoreductase n=1 Tax=Gordonia sp. (in: high G+C Gram-positive bacteria) TaxID=84139 RepID=UPI0025B952F7|nr:SDR family NAD(P)-dependent oxidoreductase [Gordonia sp. (in: high G+C Gram-positive bacteria)]